MQAKISRFVGCWLFLSAAVASAQQEDLQKARDLFILMEYRQTQAAANRVLGHPRAEPPQVREAHALIAFSLTAEGRSRQAEEVFLRLLAIEPEFSPGKDISPVLLGPFEKARRRKDRTSLDLHHVPPDDPAAKTLKVELRTNPFSLAAAVRLRWKEAGTAAWQEEAKNLPQGGGPLEFSLPASGRVEYYFQALNTAGAALVNCPSAEFFQLAPPPPLPVAAREQAAADFSARPLALESIDSGETDLGGEAAAPRWYRSWWFWTVVGVAVAGSVTAGVLLGASSGSGAADYRIIFR